jgi:hypothetical protein
MLCELILVPYSNDWLSFIVEILDLFHFDICASSCLEFIIKDSYSNGSGFLHGGYWMDPSFDLDLVSKRNMFTSAGNWTLATTLEPRHFTELPWLTVNTDERK